MLSRIEVEDLGARRGRRVEARHPLGLESLDQAQVAARGGLGTGRVVHDPCGGRPSMEQEQRRAARPRDRPPPSRGMHQENATATGKNAESGSAYWGEARRMWRLAVKRSVTTRKKIGKMAAFLEGRLGAERSAEMPQQGQRRAAIDDGGEAVREGELRLEERPVQVLRKTFGDEKRQPRGNVGEGVAAAQARGRSSRDRRRKNRRRAPRPGRRPVATGACPSARRSAAPASPRRFRSPGSGRPRGGSSTTPRRRRIRGARSSRSASASPGPSRDGRPARAGGCPA